jgi:hypothetical protein
MNSKMLLDKPLDMLKKHEMAGNFKYSPWPQSASELYRQSGRHRSAKVVVLTLASRGVHVVSATGPHGRKALFSRPEPLLIYSSSSSVDLTRLSGPRSRPTTTQKIW